MKHWLCASLQCSWLNHFALKLHVDKEKHFGKKITEHCRALKTKKKKPRVKHNTGKKHGRKVFVIEFGKRFLFFSYFWRPAKAGRQIPGQTQFMQGASGNPRRGRRPWRMPWPKGVFANAAFCHLPAAICLLPAACCLFPFAIWLWHCFCFCFLCQTLVASCSCFSSVHVRVRLFYSLFCCWLTYAWSVVAPCCCCWGE